MVFVEAQPDTTTVLVVETIAAAVVTAVVTAAVTTLDFNFMHHEGTAGLG